MDEQTYLSQAGIFFSCSGKKAAVSEHTVPEHALTRVYSGQISVTEADKTYTLNPGDTVLFTRNQLAKFTKCPTAEEPAMSVTIFFKQDFLQQYYAGVAEQPLPEERLTKMRSLKGHPLLESLFGSLTPYFDTSAQLPDELGEMKLLEAITILRSIDPGVDGILCDFSQPGKKDLAEFMNRNYMFNLAIGRFAYLTGRSLATFKRDFQKVFGMSPQRWLVQKRLERAHFLIAEKKARPSDVYVEVGFENLSHFSYAFKRLFGYNPSSLS